MTIQPFGRRALLGTGLAALAAPPTLRAQAPAVKIGVLTDMSSVYADYAAAGTVAYSYPGNGASVYPGQRVVIYVSSGPPPAQPTSEPETTLGPGPGEDDCGNSNRPECRD